MGLFLLASFTPHLTCADVKITEFVAAADYSITDQDGRPSDWIEVTNFGTSVVSLAGYSLTNNPAERRRWIFPAVNLNAGESRVVFATGKNRTDPRDELHLNFTLDREGNYLALVEPDGATITTPVFDPGYPEQFPTISYGLDGTDGVTLGHLETPTPGGPNGTVVGPPPAEVVFDVESKMFTAGFNIRLSCPTPGVTIRYTTDLSEPTGSSAAYRRAIPVTGSMQVRARAFLPGSLDGPVGVETYLEMSASVAEFSSDLPLVVQSTLGGGSPPSSGSTTRTTSYLFFFEPDPTTGRTTLTQIPNLTTRAGIRKRGNSSSSWPKYSMTIESWEDGGIDFNNNGSISLNEEQDRNIAPFGMPREGDWIISGRYQFDLALMRNTLMYDLSRQIGRYAARYQYVEFYNDVNGGQVTDSDYFGVYAFMERIEVDPNRVDIAQLDTWENSPPEVTGGYIFKKDWNDPANTTVYDVPDSGGIIAPVDPLVPSDPDGDTVTRTQESYIEQYLSEMTVALMNDPSGINRTTGLHFSDYLDVDSFIDHHCLNILTENIDWGRHSAYFHKDRNGVLFAGPIWDFDRALGSEDGRDAVAEQWDGFLPRSSMTWFDQRFAWYGYLLGPTEDRTTAYYIDIRQRHTDRWGELRKSAFSVANLHAMIDGLAAEITEAAARNFVKWTAHPPNGGPYAKRGTRGWESEVSQLKGWIEARAAWIDSQYVVPPIFNAVGGLVLDGFGLTMSSPDGDLYYTTDGSDPRAPGGGVAEGAVQYTGTPVVVNSGEIILARTLDEADWSAPEQIVVSGDLANDASLVVSELMYNPAPASAADLTAGFNDSDLFEYAELLNISDHPIALTGVAFVDGIKFNFDDGTMTFLPPGERVLLVKNEEAFKHRYSTTHEDRIIGEFQNDSNLRNSGEQLVLNAYGGGILRNFTYDDAPAWPVAADGAGYSLVLIAPETNPDHMVASNWRSSVALGGSPGFSDTIGWTAWAASHGGVTPNSDDEPDQRDALIEYAMGGDPNVPDGHLSQLTASRMMIEVADMVDEYLTISFRRNLAADDVEMAPQTTTNFSTWIDASADFLLVSETNHGDGSAILLYRSALPLDQMPGGALMLRMLTTLR
jgi:hypothetical protein